MEFQRQLKRDRNHQRVEEQLSKRLTFAAGMPHTLIIEPGARCSLACPFCPQASDNFLLSRDFLKLDDFKKIVDYFEDSVDTILLFNWGEPLLNQSLPEMISYASEKKVHTLVHSNAIHLTEDLAKKIVKSGLSEFVASIDGASEESYQKYRKNGSFQHAFGNLQSLLRVKNEFGCPGPRIVWKFLVFKHNEHELERARLLAREAGVSIEFKFAVAPGEYESSLEEFNNKNFRDKFIKNYDLPCKQLWKAPVICPDGDVLPCCMVSNKKYVVGNLFRQEFREIWNNAQYQMLRAAIAGEIVEEGALYCRECMFGPNSVK